MKRIFIVICVITMCFSIIACAPNTADEEPEATEVIDADEFKEDMQRKYNIEKIDITEKDKDMTIDYHFSLGPSDRDINSLQFETLVYYKPREDKHDTVTINIYSQDKELVKVFKYENDTWTDIPQ